MKTRVILMVLCMALVSLGANAKIRDGKALRGNSLTDLGKYTIVNADVPMVVKNQELKTYDLKYENSGTTVKIGVLTEKECKNFVVRTNDFEVQYTCNNGVFGVKKIEKRFQDLPKEEMDAKLNKVSYYAQRVICQDKKSEDELLGLIACYFPNLVNEEYQASF